MVSNKKRVVIAMSGGVDSSVSAAILHRQGYDVIGITMQLWNHGNNDKTRFDSCCSLSDIHDAKIVAHQIGIPHYVVNYEDTFKEQVVQYFADEYKNGRTPNPCVMCNSKLKFNHLLDKAKLLHADYVATGHFARIRHDQDYPKLFRGDDPLKDQSYFLFSIPQHSLSNILFPLGDMTKTEVREIAASLNLHTQKKHESQEICFVTGKRYTDFLKDNFPDATHKHGKIIHQDGRVLGNHQGIHQFTVGQRKGLGVDSTEPLYVKEIRSQSGDVIVDKLSGLSQNEFYLNQLHWLDPQVEKKYYAGEKIFCEIQIRYRSKALQCSMKLDHSRHLVSLNEPASWITPGQAAVCYHDQQVLGGGFISSNKPDSNCKNVKNELHPQDAIRDPRIQN